MEACLVSCSIWLDRFSSGKEAIQNDCTAQARSHGVAWGGECHPWATGC